MLLVGVIAVLPGYWKRDTGTEKCRRSTKVTGPTPNTLITAHTEDQAPKRRVTRLHIIYRLHIYYALKAHGSVRYGYEPSVSKRLALCIL